MGGGDVEKAKFVGAHAVVKDGLLDRIAGIAQVDEVDTFDDAAVFDVQTRDDTDFEHGVPPRMANSE